VSADLDALDRGVIEAGLMAAEALARVAALEAKVDTLTDTHRAAFRLGLEIGRRRGRLVDKRNHTPLVDKAPRTRHLKVVQP